MSDSQLAVLFRHLAAGKSITTIQATIDYGICRLSERIRELERAGWQIEHTPESKNGKRYMRYSLKQEAKAA